VTPAPAALALAEVALAEVAVIPWRRLATTRMTLQPSLLVNHK